MKKGKKKWDTPKLICLYRGRPEAVLLSYCKGAIYGPDASKCKTSGVDCQLTIKT